ncbi:hypothetical protein ACFWN5_14805 [Streptomyces sp. NPDC058430]|uniref:hypothetical protein n=1 Tax=unclassified Streptomyces TaxID=2593676 RepID=UPI0036312889
MSKRSIAVTAAIAGAAALAATGINYAAAAGTEAAPAAAPAVRQAAAPAAAPLGGDSGQGKEKEGNYNKGGYHYKGRIQFNERSYSAETDGCITVVSGLGARSFNIRNDSWKTVEVFRGATCDNGAPVATVGPWSSSTSVHPFKVRGGVFVKNGVVGSFRVVHDFRGKGGGYGGGDHGGGNW